MVDCTRSRAQKLIKSGCVLVNCMRVIDCSFKVRPDQKVSVTDLIETFDLLPDDVKFEILYEDEDIIVVDKPSGVVVHPGSGNWSGTLVNGLIKHSENLSSIGEEFLRPGIVHRIDKDTSGILVVAKNDISHAKLAEQFAKHTITRKYECFTYGMPKIDKRVQKLTDKRYMFESEIGRDRISRKKMMVLESGGKHAITIFKILDTFKDACASRIECELKTGRTHQIRVHMTHLGASLIGDQTYGKRKKIKGDSDDFVYNFPRQALHAKYLKFTHPVTLEEMEFSSQLPDDMQQLNQILSNLK